MKSTTFIMKKGLGKIIKDFPEIIRPPIIGTLILLWVFPSIIGILKFATYEEMLKDLCAVSGGWLFFVYFFPLLKLFMAALLFKSSTLKLGLALSLLFFGIYSLYMVYTLHFAATIPWTCVFMFTDATWELQLKFNLGAIALIAIVLIISIRSKKHWF